VRGLGCPVRFVLTAGQAGDAPQAAALLDGQAAEAVIADTAYDADHIRATIAEISAEAVIPSSPPDRANTRSTPISMLSATSSNAVSPSSSSSGASPPASKRRPRTISPRSPSPPSSYG
jgi:transposase